MSATTRTSRTSVLPSPTPPCRPSIGGLTHTFSPVPAQTTPTQWGMLKTYKPCLLRYPLRVWPHPVHQSRAAFCRPDTRILNRHRRPLGYIDVSALKRRWEKGETNPVCPVLASCHFQFRRTNIRHLFLYWIGYRMTRFRT
jgi:hypothetical protein